MGVVLSTCTTKTERIWDWRRRHRAAEPPATRDSIRASTCHVHTEKSHHLQRGFSFDEGQDSPTSAHDEKFLLVNLQFGCSLFAAIACFILIRAVGSI